LTVVAAVVLSMAAALATAQTMQRSVANLTFHLVLDANFNITNIANDITTALNTTNPSVWYSSDFPVVNVQADAYCTFCANAYFSAPSYKYGVSDLVSAVVSANSSSTADFMPYRLLSVVEVDQNFVPDDDDGTVYTDDTVMTGVGAGLTALSGVCVIVSILALRGKTLDTY